MALDATRRRRWFGAVALMAALAMVLGGETALKERLSAVSFLLYWLICLALTGLAILMAFLDVRALRRRIRQEQHDLLESTLTKIETEARSRRRQE